MKKIMKIVSCLVALAPVTITSTLSVSAHDLGRWADYYTDVNANGNDNFGFIDAYHIDGRTANYGWVNQLTTIKEYDIINSTIYRREEKVYTNHLELIMGDLDYNGLRENEDAEKLQDALANIITLSDLQFQLADCNLDGEISIGDAIWILTHLGNGR